MRKYQIWDNGNIEYLKDRWGEVAIKTICKNLNRSENAVRMKAKILGLGSYYRAGEFVNASTVAKMMGIDTHTITDYWIQKCGLKGGERALLKRKMYQIKLTDLMKWLKSNQDKWDSNKLELFALGEEPEWLGEKRKNDIKLPRNKFNKWTKGEENRLIFYYNQGKTQKEISEMFGRSQSGIQRKISRLKDRRLIRKKKIFCMWTEKEEKLFEELENQGHTDVEIACELGREQTHIADHRRVLRRKGLYTGRKHAAL